MILEIVTYPNKILKSKSTLIAKVDAKVKELVENMIETMYANEGLGLAAVQVGVPIRLFIIDYQQRESGEKNPENIIVFINPEILKMEEEIIMENEGCLSLPGIRADVERFRKTVVKAYDLNMQEFTIEAEDIFSIAIQHEYDHLEGILFPDRLSNLKKNILLKKYLKLKKQQKKK